MENSIRIYQDNAITSSRFEYTALERNIFYAILGKLKKGDDERQLYHVSIKELEEKSGSLANYEQYRQSTEALVSRMFEIPKENGNLLQVTMFASCEYLKGSGMIEVEISQKLRPYLFDLKKNFTVLQLEVAMALSSKYSKRLYEILSQWKNYENGIKTFDTMDLKRMLDIYNPKTGVDIYPNWSDFENRIIKVAEKDLNRISSDISFTYTKNKLSRKFVSITFQIKSKPFQKTIEFQDEDAEMFSKLMNKYKLRRDQAEAVLENNDLNTIRSTLYQIDIKKLNGEVSSVGGYTAKVFGVQ